MVKKKLIEELVLTRENTKTYPWAWADDSVKQAKIEKVLEFLPGKQRPKFFDELWRILIPDGTAAVKVPYWSSAGGVQDYEYEWPPWNDNSFTYFNAALRKTLGVENRKIKCNFDFTGGYEIDMNIAQRAEETRQFAAKHYTNTILAAQVTLVKKSLETKQ
jgi:hypothetical protein